MKIVYHFARVADTDIAGEGATPGECYQNAVDERKTQLDAASLPTTGGKIVDEDKKTIVNPLGV